MLNITIHFFETTVCSNDSYRIRTFFVARPNADCYLSELTRLRLNARRRSMAVHPSNGWRRVA
jgi:hypothetical protein